MVSTVFAVTLSVTILHLTTGVSFVTPDHDATPTASPGPHPLGELIHAALLSKEYLGHAPINTGTTTKPIQAVPQLGQTEPAATVMLPGVLTTALTSSPPASQSGAGKTVTSPTEEETTTTLITTTTITTVHMPVQCNTSLSGMEGIVESPNPLSSSPYSPLECIYSITVYPGYGVEIQVKKVNLSKDESLTILGYGGTGPELLANETLMREGQVIRSSTNQVQIYYRSLRQTDHGVFSLHYQAFLLSCMFPLSPDGGGVTVTDIHPGGHAHFHCDPGFQVRGHEVATCLNMTQPHWSSPEPQCVAVSCGGWIRNATVGRIFSPPPPSTSNHSNGNNLSCHWLLEAKEGHRLHLHFERVALDEDNDKLIVRSGNNSMAPLLFDSDLDDVPERGIVSEGFILYLELTADSSFIPLLLALRYEGKTLKCSQHHLNIRHNDVLTIFDGHDLMSHVIGQYLGSRERFQVVSGGSEVTIQFQSDPDDSSFILSQGFLIHYREVEPNDTCPALSQIEFGWISSSHTSPVRGSVLTYQCQPGYDISGSDIITCQWDLSWSNSPPTCIKVQQCPDPGEVVNGARSVRPESGFAVGTVVRFSCNQGYQLEGPGQISCHGRDTGTPKWSDRSPKCVLKYDPCPNPGVPDNGYQTLYKHSYQAGETLRFFCYEGYELIGEVIINCVPGHPSQWNSPPPFCKVSQSLEPSHQMLSENIALAIILPIILVILLIGGIYMYYTKYVQQSQLKCILLTFTKYWHGTEPLYRSDIRS
uniref:Seizure related 6 homolog (mouse)-like 2 n=1 Tax=Oncorhynchus mykiss TaxID=8022 RepID=A0A8C7UQY3_ONCMY